MYYYIFVFILLFVHSFTYSWNTLIILAGWLFSISLCIYFSIGVFLSTEWLVPCFWLLNSVDLIHSFVPSLISSCFFLLLIVFSNFIMQYFHGNEVIVSFIWSFLHVHIHKYNYLTTQSIIDVFHVSIPFLLRVFFYLFFFSFIIRW